MKILVEIKNQVMFVYIFFKFELHLHYKYEEILHVYLHF